METDLLKIDAWVHDFWKKNKIREKVLKSRQGKKKFYFLDGPPYATGYVHIGTARNKTIKDYYLRYNRMKGYDVWVQPGYDTHGLPIESKVEKKLGITSKQQIEKMGIDKFNKECAKFATEFVDFMAKAFLDLGIWYDWEHPYYTYTNEYIDGAWYTLKVAYDKGLLHKGKYPVHICPHCETASAFYEINYKSIEEEAIIVKFKLKEKKNEYLLIFTTTPWTLPANTGVMVNPASTYVRAKFGNEVWICSEDTLQSIANSIDRKYELLEKFPGKKLVGLKYEGPFSDLPLQKNITPKVVPSARFVDAKEGTGLVHAAPGHGQEDYQVGMEHGLALLSPVRLNGTYTEETGKYANKFVKDADLILIEDLEKKNLLVKTQKIEHDYPFCWRCDSALLFAAVPQWFFKVKSFKDKLLVLNEKIKWVPEWGRKRFYDWLVNISDWPISRQRYWGIPIPIWTCEKCSELKIVGSVYELPEKLKDVHRPFIDKITFKCKCGGVMKRTPDVLDVWFDSGVASWASIQYPKNKEPFESMWPPEFNTEGTDQFRGWWNSQLLTSYVTFGKLPFKAIRVHGLTWDKVGHPMSKSRGNFVEPHEIFNKYGRDALRFYLPYDDPSLEFRFDWEGRGKPLMRFFTLFFNVINYIEASGKKIDSANKLDIEDKWIISKVNSLLQKVTNFNDTYLEYLSIQAIDNFIAEEFSRFYIKIVRDRISAGDEAAIYTLYYVLDRLVKMLALLIPFSTEYIYQKLLRGKKDLLSVHLCDWPVADEKAINSKLEAEITHVKDVLSTVLALRDKIPRGIKWPIKSAVLISENEELKSAVKEHSELVKRLANILNIEISHELKGLRHRVKADFSRIGPKFGRDAAEVVAKVAATSAESMLRQLKKENKLVLDLSKKKVELERDDLIIEEILPFGVIGGIFGNYSLYLEIEETQEMLQKGFVREFTRAVQALRKKANLQKSNRIALFVSALASSQAALQNQAKEIAQKVGASSIDFVAIKAIEAKKNRDRISVKNFEASFGF